MKAVISRFTPFDKINNKWNKKKERKRKWKVAENQIHKVREIGLCEWHNLSNKGQCAPNYIINLLAKVKMRHANWNLIAPWPYMFQKFPSTPNVSTCCIMPPFPSTPNVLSLPTMWWSPITFSRNLLQWFYCQLIIGTLHNRITKKSSVKKTT